MLAASHEIIHAKEDIIVEAHCMQVPSTRMAIRMQVHTVICSMTTQISEVQLVRQHVPRNDVHKGPCINALMHHALEKAANATHVRVRVRVRDHKPIEHPLRACDSVCSTHGTKVQPHRT